LDLAWATCKGWTRSCSDVSRSDSIIRRTRTRTGSPRLAAACKGAGNRPGAKGRPRIPRLVGAVKRPFSILVHGLDVRASRSLTTDTSLGALHAQSSSDDLLQTGCSPAPARSRDRPKRSSSWPP
jgi:hypothetical protein